MPPEQRRLAAILSADVVGYSRLMGRDESGTVVRLRALRKQHFEPVLARHKGRVVKLIGDGALVEFASAVEAMAAAIEFQQAIAWANDGQAADDALVFRIGLHLGDVIVDGDDLYGDGVNIAARLEGEAPPSGIVVSSDVHNAVAGRLKAAFVDLGDRTLKNIDRPVRAMRVTWDAADWPAASDTPAPPPSPAVPSELGLALPDKPSIAVLPFQNMSGDPEQEYFADGVVEEIITALSRFRSVFVIARNSSFTYKGRAVDVKQVGRELGVRYVLEGSVRKAASHLRVTAQLIDTAAGVHIWADRFDGALEDVFDLQDQVTEKVVAALAPTVERAEMLRARRKPPGNLDAYDHYLRGLAEIPLHTREDADRLSAHISKAIELDPGFAPASGLAASCCAFRKGFGWWSDTEGELIEATRLAQAAARLGQDDAVVLCQAGYVFAYVLHDLRAGRNVVDQALALNPNVALAWASSGWIHLWQGEPSLAFEHFHRAMRLNPLDIAAAQVQSGMAHACYFLDRYDEASSWAAKLLQPRPSQLSGLRIAAASAALGGQDALMRQMGMRILALFPGFRVSSLKDHLGPYQNPDFVAKYAAGLRRAGLPD